MERLRTQTEYWNRVAGEKQFTHPLRADRLRHYVPLDGRILDVGCGYGRILAELHYLGYENAVGIDTSRGMVARGKKELPHQNMQVFDGVSIPYDDNQFDAVLLFAVLTCIPGDAEQRQLIEEVLRVLIPGGILYVSGYGLQSGQRARKRYERFVAKYGTWGVFETDDGAVCRHLAREWVDELTRPFEAQEFFELDVMTMNGHAARAFQYFGRKPGRP